MGFNSTHNLKLKMQAGKCVFGPHVGPGNDPQKTVGALKECGCDFIMLELEHALLSKQIVWEYIKACRSMDMPVLMRPEEHFANFRCFLDAGLNGLMLPLIDTVEEAAYAVKRAYFPPIGRRGCGIPLNPCSVDFQSVTDLSFLSLTEYINNNTMVFSQTESLENINNLPHILMLEGITGTITGPYDLALNIGGINPKATGNEMVNADVVKDKVRQVAKICKEIDKVAGIGGYMPKDLAEWAKEGYQLFLLGYAVDGNLNELRPIMDEMKSLIN